MKFRTLLLPAVLLLGALALSCDDDNDDSMYRFLPVLFPRTISGTITHYGDSCDLSGRTGMLAVDDDEEVLTDDPIKTWTLTWGTGNTLDYRVDISGLQDGEYYVFFNMYSETSCWVYGYYNEAENDAYLTKIKIMVENGAVIDIEITET